MTHAASGRHSAGHVFDTLPPSVMRGIATVTLGCLVLTGCNTMAPRYLGIRPDAPPVEISDGIKQECARRHEKTLEVAVACEQYLNHEAWASQLQQSYRARASLNEFAIYVAGTIALAGLGAVGGVGLAAVASAETLGLIGMSTGFASGFFGFLNNPVRAGFYTDGANDLTLALAEARTVATGRTVEAYNAATARLTSTAATAIVKLETHRFNAAVVAAQSQDVQRARQQVQDAVTLIQTAQVTELLPSSARPGDSVSVIIAGIDATANKDRIRVHVGGRDVSKEVVGKTEIKIKVPEPRDNETRSTVRVLIDGLPIPGERPLTYLTP